MSASNRANRITKLQQSLKKAYKPVPRAERPLMETLLYACLLENASYDAADEALAKLEQEYFDWNEVRVTTVTELSEVLRSLPDPGAAASRLKKNLHALFETFYSFEIDELKKQNLGKAVAQLEQLPAATPFVLSYVVQHGLGGHAVPIDDSAMAVLELCEIVTPAERSSGRVPGLERAIPKTSGVEFASSLHQMAVSYRLDPQDPEAQGVILAVNPEAKQALAGATTASEQQRDAKKSSNKSAAARAAGNGAAKKAGASKKKKTLKKATAAKSPTKKIARQKPK